MRYYILLALIPLGAYAAASIGAALLVSFRASWILRRVADRAAAERARLLAFARLLPVAAGAAVSLLLVSVFLRYEPRGTTEMPGMVLMALALVSLLLSGAALVRLGAAIRAGLKCSTLLRQCGRRWLRDDGLRIWIIETPYPIAAVTGLFHTRLLLSTRIVHECPSTEVEAIIRHEAAHVRRRDNVVRAAMRCLPDPLMLMAAGRELQDGWAAAAEEAADDEAAGPRIEARTELAAALVRVARMAEGPPPRWMPALAFYEGTNLEHRVRRLLASGTRSQAASAPRVAAAAVLIAGAAVLFTGGVSRGLHSLMELAVRSLP